MNIPGTLDFLRQAEALKNTLRNGHSTSGRPESTAEHSWRLALMAMVFARDLPEIDMAKLLKICLIHDLGEAISGDIPATRQTADGSKAAQERADLIILTAALDPECRAEILSLWEEYEAAATPEARLAKGFDKLETILQHNQGLNAPDFDYGFNLAYGAKQTSTHPLLVAIRALLDAETRSRRDAQLP